ncbi:MAG: RIP metalloprotease RseP [bacterium]
MVIGVVVLVHELGHFVAAKMSGVRVEAFSIGFPPKILRWHRRGTEYSLGLIPLGGYVKLAGMSDESLAEGDPNDPRGFNRQPFYRKLFIITAGVLMNFVLGWLFYSLVVYGEGVSKLEGTRVTMVSPDYPAYQAGIEVGDEIIEVGGVPIKNWQEMVEIIRHSPNIPLLVQFRRGDSLLSTEIIPKPTREFDLSTGKMEVVGKIGVMGTWTTEKVGLLAALGYGARQTAWVVRLNLISLKALLSGQAGLKELTGPLGIARMSEGAARAGMISFLSFIALISVSIGFLNLLPIPMLDGGHLIFIVVEAILRRQIPEKVKLHLIRIGLALLIALVLLVSYFDLIRFYLKPH